MRVTLASEPGTPGWPNEDFAAVAPGAAVLLDGATTWPPGTETGCVHGVAWYARTLGTVLLGAITADPRVPLADALARAITDVRAQHEHTCDLTSPGTPAATVSMVRATSTGFDMLALSDSSIVADYGDGRLPLVVAGPYPGASASPETAHTAKRRTLPAAGLRGIALLSDGATRITDLFGLASWPGLLTVVREQGPAELIRQVRAAEDSDPDCTRWPRAKRWDDATALYWHQPR